MNCFLTGCYRHQRQLLVFSETASRKVLAPVLEHRDQVFAYDPSQATRGAGACQYGHVDRVRALVRVRRPDLVRVRWLVQETHRESESTKEHLTPGQRKKGDLQLLFRLVGKLKGLWGTLSSYVHDHDYNWKRFRNRRIWNHRQWRFLQRSTWTTNHYELCRKHDCRLQVIPSL